MKMMEFLKKNAILFSSLFCCFIGSAVLLVFVLQKAKVIKAYQKTVDESRKKIVQYVSEISDNNPAPVGKNLENIEADINKLALKVDEIRMLYGKPYRKAFAAFAEKLGEKELDLYAKWRAKFKSEKKKNEPSQKIWTTLTGNIPLETLDAARKAFKQQLIEDGSTEVFPDMKIKIDDLILESIGCRRKMTPEECRIYISQMNNNLNKQLARTDLGKKQPISCSEKNIFYIIPLSQLPHSKDIPFILQHYRILEDIVLRLKKSGITSVKTLSKKELDPYGDNKGYFYFPYSLSVSGSLDSVRDFLNSLQSAPQDNCVYITRKVKLIKSEDEVTKLPEVLTQESSQHDTNPFKEDAVKNIMEVDESTTQVILGTSDDINAQIEIEYVVYPDEL